MPLRYKGPFSFTYLSLSWAISLPLKGQGKVIPEVLCTIAGVTNLLACLVGIFPSDGRYCHVFFKYGNYGKDLSWEYYLGFKKKKELLIQAMMWLHLRIITLSKRSTDKKSIYTLIVLFI